MAIVKGTQELSRIEIFCQERGARERLRKWEVVSRRIGVVGIVELREVSQLIMM